MFLVRKENQASSDFTIINRLRNLITGTHSEIRGFFTHYSLLKWFKYHNLTKTVLAFFESLYFPHVLDI
jgi:hypothetical protein